MHNKPDVLLATTSTCPHCPSMKRQLQQLDERGLFSSLQIVDLSQAPQLAAQYQIRSVPWLKMGELVFTGVYSLSELLHWADIATTDDGIRQYLSKELQDGRLGDVEKQIAAHPEWLATVISLLADMDTPMQARIGLTALIEGIHDQALLNSILPALEQFSRHSDQRVRCDACHLLANSKSEAAKQILQQCLQDPEPQVREIAEESLALFE